MNNKKDQELAQAHVNWLMPRIRQIVTSVLDSMEPLLVDHMVHGIKHGRELAQEEGRKVLYDDDFVETVSKLKEAKKK